MLGKNKKKKKLTTPEKASAADIANIQKNWGLEFNCSRFLEDLQIIYESSYFTFQWV